MLRARSRRGARSRGSSIAPTATTTTSSSCFPRSMSTSGRTSSACTASSATTSPGIGLPILDAGRDYGCLETARRTSTWARSFREVRSRRSPMPSAWSRTRLPTSGPRRRVHRPADRPVPLGPARPRRRALELLPRLGRSVMYGSDWRDRETADVRGRRVAEALLASRPVPHGPDPAGSVRPLDLLEPVRPTPCAATDLPPPDGTRRRRRPGAQVTIERDRRGGGAAGLSGGRPRQKTFRAAFVHPGSRRRRADGRAGRVRGRGAPRAGRTSSSS